jgi:acyl carrier protein
MTDELTQRVIAIIADTQQIPPETIRLDSSFEDLGIDSLGGLTIVGEMESEFDVSLPNEEALMIRTVGQAVDALRRNLPGGEGTG